MKKTLCFVLLALFAVSIVGCETFKGLGKDIENTGKNIQGVFTKEDKMQPIPGQQPAHRASGRGSEYLRLQ